MLVLSRYSETGASSRLRMLQFLPYLRDEWEVEVTPFFPDTYLKSLYRGETHLRDIAFSYLRRLYAALRLRQFDLAWVEAELLPWIPWRIEKLFTINARSVAADYDDAIFHKYDNHPSSAARCLLGKKIACFMRHAKTVLAGNEYIASYAHDAGARRVELVPTVVDTSRYEPRIGRVSSQLTIGWIGTPKTQHYLHLVAEALDFAHRILHARIVVIGAAGSPLLRTPVEVRAWNESTEAAELRAIDVGIMPLADSPWELGKCGYKLIQYMACGKPVVASPIGINRTLVEHGINGYLASTTDEWINAFRLLDADPHRASQMGQAGRSKVERAYSLTALAPRLKRILAEATD